MDVSRPPLILSAWSNRMNTQAIAVSPPHSRSAKGPASFMELVYPRLTATLDLCT
jgi:hypothetical protein